MHRTYSSTDRHASNKKIKTPEQKRPLLVAR